MSPTFRVRHTPRRPSEARDRLLLLLLIELLILNVADLALTRYAMWLGFATESNGVMDYFLRAGTLPALLFKVGIVSLGALLLWRLRVYVVATVCGGADGLRLRRRRRLPGVLGDSACADGTRTWAGRALRRPGPAPNRAAHPRTSHAPTPGSETRPAAISDQVQPASHAKAPQTQEPVAEATAAVRDCVPATVKMAADHQAVR